MNTEISTVKRLKITDLINSEFVLDPVTVFMEDHETGKGKITIECYGRSWSAYWGGMGDRTIAEFFCSCDDHYIAGKLTNISSDIPDYSALVARAKEQIIERRKSRDIAKDEARELFDDARSLEVDSFHELDHRVMHAIFGEEWWHSIPEKPNPDYEYLCRIIRAVQAGLKHAGIVKKREAA